MNVHFKSDERILGDSNFVEKVLCDATEKMERRYRLEAMGYDFDTVVKRVSEIFTIAVNHILSPGKQPERVMARSVLAYWSVRELGISGTNVGERLGLSQSAISRSVQRGEQLVSEHRLSLYDTRNA
jgi:chromosomal replication initiation ATPase DnaA